MPKRKGIRGAGGRGKKRGSFTVAFLTALAVGGVITFVLLRAPQAPYAPTPPAVLRQSDIARSKPILPAPKHPRTIAALPRPRGFSIIGKPAIAIVIDDLGNDVPATRRAIALPRAVTLSFLPYPNATPELAGEAGRAGHQILVHVPMEPEGSADPGPMALRTAMTAPEIVRRLDWDLSRVPGFSGINNHMGSKFTADPAALTPVLDDLSRRGVFFFDSRTTAGSHVVELAERFGVATAARDTFLDDANSHTSVSGELDLLARRATQQGTAIGIGHPHAATLAAIEAWLDSRVAHEFALVPVSVAIALKSRREMATTN
jgi:polysaccharide deacetylase 2 family uncharacterized protein YibQ